MKKLFLLIIAFTVTGCTPLPESYYPGVVTEIYPIENGDILYVLCTPKYSLWEKRFYTTDCMELRISPVSKNFQRYFFK